MKWRGASPDDDVPVHHADRLLVDRAGHDGGAGGQFAADGQVAQDARDVYQDAGEDGQADFELTQVVEQDRQRVDAVADVAGDLDLAAVAVDGRDVAVQVAALDLKRADRAEVAV